MVSVIGIDHLDAFSTSKTLWLINATETLRKWWYGGRIMEMLCSFVVFCSVHHSNHYVCSMNLLPLEELALVK